MDKTYKIETRSSKWRFIDGYSCKAKSIDHFLKHISYRFSKYYNMYDLEAGYKNKEFKILVVLIVTTNPEDEHVERLRHDISKDSISDGYYDDYSFVIDYGDGESITGKMEFVSDSEARDWIDSQK